jgi:hypothetical protein
VFGKVMTKNASNRIKWGGRGIKHRIIR